MEARVAEGVREILGPLRNQRLCALDTVVPSLAHSLASALARTELMLVEAGRYELPANVREDFGGGPMASPRTIPART